LNTTPPALPFSQERRKVVRTEYTISYVLTKYYLNYKKKNQIFKFIK